MSSFSAADARGNLKANIATTISNDAVAVIIINSLTGGDYRQISALNAPYLADGKTAPVPIVVVAPRYLSSLKASSKLAALDVKGKYSSARPFRSVYGRLRNSSDASAGGQPGKGKTLCPRHASTRPNVLITTPISGWHRCGGERGPGVAILLALLRRLSQSKSRCFNYHFIANSGHELSVADGNLGLVQVNNTLQGDPCCESREKSLLFTLKQTFKLLDKHAGRLNLDLKPQNTAVWLSLGASIATIDGMGKSAFSDASIGRAVSPALRRAGFSPTQLNKADHGEVQAVRLKGYRTFGFDGAFSRFHTVADDASSTNQVVLERASVPPCALPLS